MSVDLQTPTALGQGRFKIVAEIQNFDPAVPLTAELTLDNDSKHLVMPVAPVAARMEIETATLTAFTRADARLIVRGTGATGQIRDDVNWMVGAPEASTMTATVGDAGTITLTGYGLGRPSGMRLGIRATPDAAEEIVELLGFHQQDDTCTAVVPVLLSSDQERTFPGIVPPSKVYLTYFDGNGFVNVPAGMTQLKYRIGRPTPNTGAAGSTFEVLLFHPARAPDLTGVTVSFDGTALAPISVTELGDITAGGFIYLTRSQFRVPAGATVGLHQVTAKTSFDEVLLSNGPDFTVTP